MSKERKQPTEAAARDIRLRTRRKFSPKEKVRIVLEGLRGEQNVSELRSREGTAANLYYRWSKDFFEAGKKQLRGDTVPEATSDEVKGLRSESRERTGQSAAPFRPDVVCPRRSIQAGDRNRAGRVGLGQIVGQFRI